MSNKEPETTDILFLTPSSILYLTLVAFPVSGSTCATFEIWIEASIHISNVAHVDPETGKATRVKYKIEDGVKKRISVVSGSLLDK